MKCFNNYIVDIEVLKNNARNIKLKIGDNKKLCAVIKANAYGIGMQSVCKALYGIADFFACASIKEALGIRVFDKTTPILVLGYIDDSDLNVVADNNISISVGSLEQLQKYIRFATKKIKVHIQVNTGLNRFGFRSITCFKQALKLIDNNDNFVLEGVYSHFATKKNDIAFMKKQYLRFLQFKKNVYDPNVIMHISNSYGILESNKFYFDMVRSGFLLYGYTENNIGNKPIIQITSEIISMQKIKKGDTVGYDRTYTAKCNTQIAVIPIGYADGFNRRLSNNFSVIINNKKYPIIGRVCMDVFMVDVGKNQINIGDQVVLLGKMGKEEITLDDYANALNTSSYEVICNFNYKRMNYLEKGNNNT